MFRATSLSHSYLYDHGFRQESKKQFELTQKNIEKIRKIALKKIYYTDFQKAYDYVDALFPGASVKDVVVFKVAARDMDRMGYHGVEGFYDPVTKIVVLCGAHRSSTPVNRTYHIEAKVSKDEVIVHELCHYCYVALGHRSVSSEIREEFAYGWSIGYLRSNGHSDEHIIKYNFLPHLMNISYDEATRNILAMEKIETRHYNAYSKFKYKEFKRKYGRRIFTRAKELAMEKGWKIMGIYSDKLEEGTDYRGEEDNCDRFDLLDL
ncbi:MAG: hypothetical protein ACTSSP_07225 [Candidatus Asgardarchaeia archaeon]